MAKWCIIAAALLIIGLVGCGPAATPTPTPGPTAIPSGGKAAATVRGLIDHSTDYADQAVTLTGTIAMECSQGCWFFLDDGTARIYVDLSEAGISIPQWVGSRVTVVGKIKGAGGNLQLLGNEVTFLK